MIKKPKLKHLHRKAKDAVPEVLAEKAAAALKPIDTSAAEPLNMDDVPNITTESIAVHREEVLKGARKYIYPLQHSKRTIITVTSSVIVVALISLLVYCSLALYKFYQYNTFVYRVTQVMPFPIAKAGGHYVSYENYLFELRHNIHYNETQQQSNFAGADHQQLLTLRKQALQTAVNHAYIKQLAGKNQVSVSSKEVNERLDEVRAQNRLGGNDKVFSDVLNSYWGWSISDFKRSLKQEILAEKVAAALDTKTNQRANAALAQIKSGADFVTLAKEVSDDPTAKATGGDYGFPISKTNPNLPPAVINALFNMKAGDVSGVVLASPVLASQGPSLQIVKLTAINGNSLTALHMVFNLQGTDGAVNQLKIQKPVHNYVHF